MSFYIKLMRKYAGYQSTRPHASVLNAFNSFEGHAFAAVGDSHEQIQNTHLL